MADKLEVETKLDADNPLSEDVYCLRCCREPFPTRSLCGAYNLNSEKGASTECCVVCDEIAEQAGDGNCVYGGSCPTELTEEDIDWQEEKEGTKFDQAWTDRGSI